MPTNRFLYSQTESALQEKINSGELSSDTICFVEDANSIYTHDTWFGPKRGEQHKVLWVGTSIPAGDGDNNYPKMVADALDFKLYNNSIGSSFVSHYPNNGIVNDESYYWTEKSDIKEWVGFSLSSTKDDVESKFRPVLENIQANDSTLTDAEIENYIATWKWASYESRIIPYIDGTIDTCDTIIIDHGYNDRDNIYILLRDNGQMIH